MNKELVTRRQRRNELTKREEQRKPNDASMSVLAANGAPAAAKDERKEKTAQVTKTLG